MKQIIAPINAQSAADLISNLQEGLQLLGMVLTKTDITRKTFGRSTIAAINKFQQEQKLTVTGDIDAATATRLNKLLKAKGAFGRNPIIRPVAKGTIKVNLWKRKLTDLGEDDKDTATVVDAALNDYFLDRLEDEGIKLPMSLKEAIAAQKIDFRSLEQTPVRDMVKQLILPELAKNETLKKQTALLARSITKLSDKKVTDLLQLDKSLREHPALEKEIRQTKNTEYGTLVNISKPLLDKLVTMDIDISDADDDELDGLVTQKLLTADQLPAIKMAGELGRLTEDNIPLIAAVQKKQAGSLAGLARMEKADWLKMITDEKAPLPDDTTADEYAARIMDNIEQAFPTQVFVQRAIAPEKAKMLEPLARVNNLLAANKKLVSRDGIEVTDWKDLPADEIKKQEEGLRQLSSLANTYHYLGIGDVLNDAATDVATKQATVNKRISTLNTFIKKNPELELNIADFFADTLDEDGEEKINWTGVAADEKPLVRKQLMAYQRLGELGDDVATRTVLLEKGFDSAMRIADMSEPMFIQKSGLEKSKAKIVYGRATDKAMTAAHQFASIHDIVKGGFKDLGVANIRMLNLVNDLKDVDGLADLFGSQDYCDCDECRSIFSPAAYFTDLMLFIEKNITKAAFAGKPNHPINLKTRRPDLWTLPLTCKNTNTLIPYLDVVNDILENFLEKAKGMTNVFEKLSLGTEKVSFRTPFNLPLEEARTYLAHFGVKLPDILSLLQRPPADIQREQLNISREEFEVITESALPTIQKRYGDLATLSVADLVRFAGITRKNLDEILALTSTDTLNGLSIEKTKAAGDVQPTGEKFKGLTSGHLDFIHRFVRLWKKTSWTIPEFDRVIDAAVHLATKANEQPSTRLNAAVVQRIASLYQLAQQLKLTAEEVCGVTDVLPAVAVKNNQPHIYNRLFNAQKTNIGSATEADYHHYSRNTIDPTDDKTHALTPVLLNGLGISETELVLLFDLLQIPLGFDDKGKTKLDREKLSLLYRHTRLAKAFRLSIAELVMLIKLAITGKKFISGTTQIDQLVSFREWMTGKPFSVAELWFLTKQQNTDTLQLAGTPEAVITWLDTIVAENRLVFTAADLAKATGLPAADSDNLLKALLTNAWITESDKKLRITPSYALVADFTPVWTAMNATDAIKETEPALRDFLNSYHPKISWYTLLAEALNTGTANLLQLTAFLPPALADATYFMLTDAAVPATDAAKKEAIDKTAAHTSQLGIYLLLFEKLKLKANEINFALANPVLFGLDAATINRKTISALHGYKKLSALQEDPALLLHPLLLSAQAEQKFTDTAIAQLAQVLGRETIFIRSLVRTLPLAAAPFDAIDQVKEAMALCDVLGINGYALTRFTGSSFDDWSQARDIAIGAFGRYTDETQRTEKMASCKDAINVKKRDTLCDYIIALQKELKFEDHAQLYSYFLLDVDMGGCFRTSRLVAAISSLQLYVHRVLLNLEQSGNENNAYSDVNVMAAIKTKEWAQLVQEWEWRKNYRVWEANRKVFLYPENYIEPDLRDNKSPLFKELEEELLQQKISKESAEEAYRKYLTQFAELAKLKIAGCYYHDLTNTYYFFGCTHISPYQYYVRKWDNCTEWTPWEKISLSINAPNVSGVIHLGKLYVFWVDVNVREKNKISKGNSEFDQYDYTVYLNYAYRNENGKWSSPQKMPGLYDFHHKEFVIPDDVENDKLQEKIEDDIAMLEKAKKMLNTIVADTSAIDARINELKNQLIKLAAEEDVHEIAVQENREVEDVLNFYYKHSKTYLKSYPVLDEGKICIEYAWMRPWVEMFESGEVSPFEFGTFANNTKESAINLFHNKLEGTVLPKEGDKRLFLKTICAGDNGKLVLRKVMHWTEGRADTQLEVFSQNGSDIVLTNTFDYSGIRPELATVNSSFGDYILVLEGQSYLVKQKKKRTYTFAFIQPAALNTLSFFSSERNMVRLSSTLADPLGMKLMNEGIDAFLGLQTQKLTEEGTTVAFTKTAELMPAFDNPQHIDFRQSSGEYYRELFFHIPFLIANHLNANGKFKEAKYWYEKIFNPTAAEDDNSDKPTERNWQYIEFRNLHIDSLKEILTDTAAIAKYKADPFNPHAIARLRLNAYQKSVVMKYIDNLVDWGDQLFTQDTMESINEATMLYILAADILGKRPASLGKCETVPESALTYNEIKDDIEAGSEFLIQMENWHSSTAMQMGVKKWKLVADKTMRFAAEHATPVRGTTGTTTGTTGNVRGVKMATERRKAKKMQPYREIVKKEKKKREMAKMPDYTFKPATRMPGLHMIQQSRLAFCIPPNYDLHKYWDRVEDRLFKIRNCMNINGVRRQLSLFQPPIDPMMLVRARAAGLSIDDVLSMLSVQLPPYRFSYLVEKALQYTSTVQSFGASLLSALEKKDVEELTLLRSVQEQNILKMMTGIKTKSIEEAKAQLISTIEARTNVYNRHNYYFGLVEGGLNTWETTQQVSKHIATAHQAVESVLRGLAGTTYLIPQIGSPFSLKWGGKEMADSMNAFADVARNGYQLAEAISASAGLEATFQRREEDWKHNLSQAAQELKSLDQQIIALEIKVAIAEKDLDTHTKQMEQAEELNEFYKNKFSNLGLYTYLSSSLNRLYRQAFNMAQDMARLAEQAYRFECDENSFVISNDNWQFDRAGLLAGERLCLQLQQLEKMYIEKNLRNKEITQSFSLQMLAPEKLMQLRQKGSCEAFEIPEMAYDLIYPGQYKRIIKSVRLTIPCITGPYSNIGCKLSLIDSKVRSEPAADAPLLNLAAQKLTSIATSTAQNDSGLFELNFRDERYLPFEGAGAISTWNLELPARMRTFDYNSISDVIFHVSYTAKDDGLLKETVEQNIETAITEYATANGLFRLFSMKNEFPEAWHRLLYGPGDAPVTTEFTLGSHHFPYLFADKAISLAEGRVYMKPVKGQTVNTGGLSVKLNSFTVSAWTNFPDDAAMDPLQVLKMGTVPMSGDPFKKWVIAPAGDGFNKEEIDDMLILLKYTIG